MVPQSLCCGVGEDSGWTIADVIYGQSERITTRRPLSNQLVRDRDDQCHRRRPCSQVSRSHTLVSRPEKHPSFSVWLRSLAQGRTRFVQCSRIAQGAPIVSMGGGGGPSAGPGHGSSLESGRRPASALDSPVLLRVPGTV